MYKTMPFPIIEVTLIDKSSMVSKKFFVPAVSKLKVDALMGWLCAVCWVEADLATCM
jgi:hypothetical protein